MAKQRFEKRSFATALLTYLQDRNWNITEVKDWKDDELIPPAVSVHYLPSRVEELQLGRDKKSFRRQVQVDVYMENENRAEAIIDAIGDFMDEVPIEVRDNTGTLLASMICFDTESISLDTPPLIASDPNVVRWRGVAKCVYNIDYIV